MKVLGLEVERGIWTHSRSVIGEVERTVSGNVALRIGQEEVNGGGATTSWRQTEHVTLTRAEAAELAAALLEATA